MSYRHTAAAAVTLLAIATLLLSGCSLIPSESSTTLRTVNPANNNVTTGQYPTAQICAPGEQRSGTTCTPCANLDECYTSSAGMENFYSKVIETINEFSVATYKNMSAPNNWYYVAEATTGTVCNEQYDATAFFYCPTDRSVYVGQRSLWEYYSEVGDAGAAVGIAHEWGHHVQNVAGVLGSSQKSQAVAIAKENQADCIAGSWLGFMAKQGRVSRQDYGDVTRIIAKIASSEDDPTRNHGTLAERSRSLMGGLNQGITSCNAFFAQKPIISVN